MVNPLQDEDEQPFDNSPGEHFASVEHWLSEGEQMAAQIESEAARHLQAHKDLTAQAKALRRVLSGGANRGKAKRMAKAASLGRAAPKCAECGAHPASLIHRAHTKGAA